MTIGQISADREAIVTVRLRGSDGAETEIEAVLDTGFSDFLTLPLLLIDALLLPRLNSAQIRLADGSFRRVDVYEGRIRWAGTWRAIPIQASENAPLLGMGLLFGSLLCLELAEGGSVTAETLE